MRPATVELAVVGDRWETGRTEALGLYAAAIALAVVAPRAAAFGYLLIAVAVALRVRADEPAAEPA
jgi:hypothetical protein